MTEQINVMTPRFYENFSCIGADCEDHCCHSWNVFVNKKSYKQLKNTKDKDVKSLTVAHFKLTRTSESNWAFIQMKDDGNCPVLDSEGLCNIQKNLSHEYLPHTCQDYPRINNLFGDQVEPSLFMSCPTAAKNILLDTSSMMFESSNISYQKLNQKRLSGFEQNSLPYWLPIVREVCFQIILDQEASFEERLFSLGLFLKQAENRLASSEQLQTFIDNYIHMYNEKKPHKMFASLPSVDNLKWQVFSAQDHLLVKNTNVYTDKKDTQGLSTSAVRFQQCRDQLLSLFNHNGKPSQEDIDQESQLGQFTDTIEGNAELFNQIVKKGQKQYLDKFFDENPQILTNFALYYIYHHQFLLHKNKSLFDFFKVMTTDIFMIKCYLSAISVNQKNISETWVLQLFQSYSRKRQHGRDFIEQMEQQLTNDSTDSAGAIFGLLK